MAPDLPPGWTITGSVENVPNPNFGTPYGQTFFARKTFTCTDALGNFVCASGSEDDCNTQALTMAQSRTQQQPYNEAI